MQEWSQDYGMGSRGWEKLAGFFGLAPRFGALQVPVVYSYSVNGFVNRS